MSLIFTDFYSNNKETTTMKPQIIKLTEEPGRL